MNEIIENILENYNFSGKKLRIMIDLKAGSTGVAISKVRAYIKLCLGKSRQMLQLWESGKNQPGVNELIWFRKFFGIDNIEYFFEKEMIRKKKSKLKGGK